MVAQIRNWPMSKTIYEKKYSKSTHFPVAAYHAAPQAVVPTGGLVWRHEQAAEAEGSGPVSLPQTTLWTS